MTFFHKCLLAGLSLQLSAAAYADPPKASGTRSTKVEKTQGASAPASKPVALSDAERYARRCQHEAPHREHDPQGTMLWGTRRDWDTEKPAPESTSVLVSVALGPVLPEDTGLKALALQGGHLDAAPAGKKVVGAVLPGLASDGTPVEVAICDAESSPEDPNMVWYRIEVFNTTAQEWENPCIAVDSTPQPRAVAVGGVWDMTGARHEQPGRFTFACENGAIAKCINWGYKPWESYKGTSLTGLHQACTRMARADYCGDGRSYTHQDTIIDRYDRLGLSTRTTKKVPEWDPDAGSFEAAWGPDGATCLAHTRDGRELKTVLKDCPKRFRKSEGVDLGEGDRCAYQRVGVDPKAFAMRNMSYGVPPGAPPPPARKR